MEKVHHSFRGTGSEPWWPMLVLRAQIGPVDRVFELATEIENRIDTYGFSSWGARIAFSAALGEVALQWALADHGDSARSMLDRVIEYCERVGHIEADIDTWKTQLAVWLDLIGQTATSLAIQRTLVWQRENGRFRGGKHILEHEASHERLFDLLEDLRMAHMRWLPPEGEPDDSTITVGTKEYVASGVNMVRSLIRGMERENEPLDLGEARRDLAAALARIAAGEWESTRGLWSERSLGVLLVGRALYWLAQRDSKLAAEFLEGYFDFARKNGRHACWVHLVAAAPALELLEAGLWPKLWQLLEPIELLHKPGVVLEIEGQSGL